jgi:integrase
VFDCGRVALGEARLNLDWERDRSDLGRIAGQSEVIRPAAERAKITKHISWHVFRHTFSTLLAENDEDVKTVQSLMRHANSNITMNIYTHAVSSKRRRAQSKVVEMTLPAERATPVSAGVA